MSKKSKKTKNNWDVSADEQLRMADKLYEYEIGKISDEEFKRLGDNSSSLFDYQLEKMIVESLGNKEPIRTLEPTDMRTNMEIQADKPKYTSKIDTSECRKISINNKYANDLYKITIDDEISPTSLNLALALDQDISACNFNADVVYEMIKVLFNFTIIQKYPTAIYELKEFINGKNYDFNTVVNSRYSHDKFKFVESNGYVLCYVLDDDSIKEFQRILDENAEYDIEELLKTYYSMAITARSVMQTFFPKEAWLINEMHSSIHNQKDIFHEVFINDKQTLTTKTHVYTPENVLGIELVNVDEIITTTESVIRVLGGEDELDDDDLLDEIDPDEVEKALSEALTEAIKLVDEESNKMVNINDPVEVITELSKPEEKEVSVTESKVVTNTESEVSIKESTVVTNDDTKEVIASIDKEINELLSDDMEVIEEKTVTKLKTTDDDNDFKIPVIRRK